MKLFSFLRGGDKQEKTAAPAEKKLSQKISKTGSRFRKGLLARLLGKSVVDEELLEELESELLMADVGVPTTTAIMAELQQQIGKGETTPEQLRETLRTVLLQQLSGAQSPLEITAGDAPYVILVVGVNGSGKTTTIGKLAKQLQSGGLSVMLAAGDTFRAAAVEQLQTWGERNNVPVVAQGTGSDSASVIYDALESARAKGINVLIADTAGRLQTQANLMDELAKVVRVMGKLDDSAPHEVLLVLDGSTGQNALSQARMFRERAGVSGLALTKLDGTAKGGVIFAIAKELGLPLRFIGVGEGIDDLRPFIATEFVDALLDNEAAE